MSGSGLAARWMKETLTKTSFLPPRKGDRNAVAAKRHQGATGPRPKVGVQARGPPKSRYSGRSTGLTEAPHAPRAGGALGPREQGRKKEGAPDIVGPRLAPWHRDKRNRDRRGHSRQSRTVKTRKDRRGQSNFGLRPAALTPPGPALPCPARVLGCAASRALQVRIAVD